MIRAGVQAQVLLEFIIDRNGVVVDPHVVSSNNPWFDRAAIDSVLQWRFEPAFKNGKPVNTRTRVPIVFQVQGSSNTGPWKITKAKDHGSLPPEFRWETAPQPVSSTFPVYPFNSLRSGTKGSTKVQFIIGKNGAIIESTVLKATSLEMGDAVLAAIETWRFKPARNADGTPCLARLAIEHRFDPSGSGDVPVVTPAREILRLLEKHPDRIKELNELDSVPEPVSRRPPVYPTALRKEGVDGSAVIEFYIDSNGDAQLPRTVSATALEFGYAAVQAVATWRFTPPLVKGSPVVARARIPVTFSFQDESVELAK